MVKDLQWEVVPETPREILRRQISLIIQEAMPRNASWFRVSLATHNIMQAIEQTPLPLAPDARRE